jgi:hypothetical protein
VVCGYIEKHRRYKASVSHWNTLVRYHLNSQIAFLLSNLSLYTSPSGCVSNLTFMLGAGELWSFIDEQLSSESKRSVTHIWKIRRVCMRCQLLYFRPLGEIGIR